MTGEKQQNQPPSRFTLGFIPIDASRDELEAFVERLKKMATQRESLGAGDGDEDSMQDDTEAS